MGWRRRKRNLYLAFATSSSEIHRGSGNKAQRSFVSKKKKSKRWEFLSKSLIRLKLLRRIVRVLKPFLKSMTSYSIVIFRSEKLPWSAVGCFCCLGSKGVSVLRGPEGIMARPSASLAPPVWDGALAVWVTVLRPPSTTYEKISSIYNRKPLSSSAFSLVTSVTVQELSNTLRRATKHALK